MTITTRRRGMLFSLSILFAACLTARANTPAENWPQWRGPSATGASDTAKPPMEWSETKNVKWKVKLPGFGTSTPIVWGDRIFIQTAINTGNRAEGAAQQSAADQGNRRGRGGPGRGGAERPSEVYKFVLLCLDRKTGKTLWEKTPREEVPHEGHHPDHGYASGSPVTDGEHVYAFFGSRGLHCYTVDGELKWSKDLGKMRTTNSFGEGASPFLYGDSVIVTWDHEGDDFIVVYDKKTGNERWRKERDERTSWATPIVMKHNDQEQVITSASNRIRSYDLKDGTLIWECSGLTMNVIPSPVGTADTVYAMSGFRGAALLAIKLGHTGSLMGTDAIAWTRPRATPYVSSPLLYNGKLYFFSNNNAILTSCDAATGKVLIDTQRVDAMEGVYASPTAANGKVYLVGRNGATVVLKDSDKYEELAVNQLDDDIEASPALVGSEIFLRGHHFLYCISESK